MSDLDKMLEQAEAAIEKGQDLSEIDADHRGKDHEKPKSQKEKIENQIRDARMKKEAGETENEEAQEDSENLEKTEGQEKAKKKTTKAKKAKVRSKKYQEVAAQIDRNKKYSLEESIELVKKTSTTKFDGNIEVHIRVLGKSGKPEQVRGLIQYPHSTGRSVKVVILDDEVIEEITKTGKVEADIYLATPAQMPKVGKLARILGPKGKMPNPKSGTVTMDPEKTKKEMEAGQAEYKTDSYGIIHQVIGKVSADTKLIEENYKTLFALLPKEKVDSITLCATMGPGIKIQK